MLVVNARSPDDVREVKSARRPTRLGHSVFQTGRLDPDAIERTITALREFAGILEDQGVHEYRAVVTAAARSAKNGKELLERAWDEAGIELRAIGGAEEARLMSTAIERKIDLEGRNLLIDLGGGSLELNESNEQRDGFTESLQIGTVRILEAFLTPETAVTAKQDSLVREYVDRVLAPHRRTLRRLNWDEVIGTGGNLVAAARLCPSKKSSTPAIKIESARELLAEMKTMSSPERAKKWSLRSDRADVIVPALYVIVALADLARVGRIVVPGVGLKDGIAAELVGKHFRVWDYTLERDKLISSALQLGRRYHFDERHAKQVSKLACELFDGTRKVHKLAVESRGVLQVAALLHDVGDFVNPSSHHKHSQYIIENSEIIGLSRDHRKLVALVARYHRRGVPSSAHASYKSLSGKDQRRVATLASLLRIADALDRGHRAKIEGLRVKVKQDAVTLQLDTDNDVTLESWTVDRKAMMFRDLFDLNVRLKLQKRDED